MKILFRSRTYILAFIVILLIQVVYIIPAEAVSSSSSNLLDAVFLMDASGSMKKSDPEELRNEAIKLFLDMSTASGSKFGLVAYSDTIVREHNLDMAASSADKDNIKNMTQGIPFGQKTDTGLGLKEAVKLMEKGHEEGHIPIIILLSDGKNDPKRSSADSLKDINDAINTAKAKNYPIYTIGLDFDGTVDKAQLSEISNSTGGKNYITDNPKDLTSILTNIYTDINNANVNKGGTSTGNKNFQKSANKNGTAANKNPNSVAGIQNGVLYLVLVILIILLFIVLIIVKRSRRKKGFGRIMLEVKDEKTQETMSPQYKALDGYVDKFSLYEVLGLKEEYSETANLYFKFGNDALLLDNESKCIVQRFGRIIEKGEKLQLTSGERIVAVLAKASKSVAVEFFAE